MRVKVIHNFDKIAQTLNDASKNISNNVLTRINSPVFDNDVKKIVESEIDKLGFASRAEFLKRSFRFLATEVTASGLVYRITSDSAHVARLSEGARPSALYTIGAKLRSDGLYSGVEPTGLMERIELQVQSLIYNEIQTAVATALTQVGIKC